jgi:tetratricopeptide (TPR) repeat protein
MDYDRLRELQEKFEENPRRYFAPLANEYRKGGQAKRAIEICREQLAHMPGHMSGQIVYGQALYETGEFEEARKVFLRALAVDPENLIALRTLGDMSLQAGETTEARTWYSKLLEADPKDTAAIALVTEIDAAADAAPVTMAAEIPGVDSDAGDQEIPAAIDEEPSLQAAPASPEAAVGSGAQAGTEEPVADSAETTAASAGETDAPAGLERHYPVRETAADAVVPETGIATEGLASKRADDSDALGGVSSAKADVPPPLSTARHDESPQPSTASRDEPAPGSRVSHSESPSTSTVKSERPRAEPTETAPPASGAGAEPFVNETMAQLYLQQGYKQLALKVYRQLAESRPGDYALRDRIREIEAADAAEHPSEEPAARREEPSIERSPRRESVEVPVREAPRAEPDGFAGRQPSMREFFATLGRRRPPRAATGAGSRSGNSQPAENNATLGASPRGASLDTVFAGATVSPADARAASRLAGAFSGATGASRTPPTPPMPTPRVNPRLPHAQESEEDVAKFRAWLDGLTGE